MATVTSAFQRHPGRRGPDWLCQVACRRSRCEGGHVAGLHDSATVGDLVTSVLRRFPDRVAFRQDGKEWTYRQTEDALVRWVALLLARGLRPGEGVGLLTPNRPEAWLGQVAPA